MCSGTTHPSSQVVSLSLLLYSSTPGEGSITLDTLSTFWMPRQNNPKLYKPSWQARISAQFVEALLQKPERVLDWRLMKEFREQKLSLFMRLCTASSRLLTLNHVFPLHNAVPSPGVNPIPVGCVCGQPPGQLTCSVPTCSPRPLRPKRGKKSSRGAARDWKGD